MVAADGTDGGGHLTSRRAVIAAAAAAVAAVVADTPPALASSSTDPDPFVVLGGGNVTNKATSIRDRSFPASALVPGELELGASQTAVGAISSRGPGVVALAPQEALLALVAGDTFTLTQTAAVYVRNPEAVAVDAVNALGFGAGVKAQGITGVVGVTSADPVTVTLTANVYPPAGVTGEVGLINESPTKLAGVAALAQGPNVTGLLAANPDPTGNAAEVHGWFAMTGIQQATISAGSPGAALSVPGVTPATTVFTQIQNLPAGGPYVLSASVDVSNSQVNIFVTPVPTDSVTFWAAFVNRVPG